MNRDQFARFACRVQHLAAEVYGPETYLEVELQNPKQTVVTCYAYADHGPWLRRRESFRHHGVTALHRALRLMGIALLGKRIQKLMQQALR